MPEIKRITDFSQVEELYRQQMKKDFPRNELRPLSTLRRSWEREEYDGYVLMEEGEILGYAFFVRMGRYYLLDYLAIAEECREQGYGSLFLQKLSIPGAECVICEVENPDKGGKDQKQLERRMDFYLRNGYRKTGVTSCVFRVDYRILEVTTTGCHADEEITAFYTEVYRKLLPEPFYSMNFRVT